MNSVCRHPCAIESDIVDVQTHDCKDFGPTSTYIAGTIPKMPEIRMKYN